MLLALHSQAGKLASAAGAAPEVPASLPLPANLFIVGTVNVDETTYMFSPKVLDRANVIEFRPTADQLTDFLDDPGRLNLHALQDDATGRGLAAGHGAAFVTQAGADVDLAALGDTDVPLLKQALLAVFDLLHKHGAEFGFRSAHEMVRFVVLHKALSGPGWTLAKALDAQVLQKLLPRLHGSARKLDPVLSDLLAFALLHSLPDTVDKLQPMQRRLQSEGFASFAEA